MDSAVRPNWDKVHLDAAKAYAQRSTCPRMHVGAVFVKDNHPVSVGYNGSPAGQDHCSDVGCDLYWYGNPDAVTIKINDVPYVQSFQRCRRAIHAEPNAIGYAARAGIALAGSTLYTYPVGPCGNCELIIATTGIKEIVFPKKPYIYDVSAPLLKSMGVIVREVEYGE